MVPVVLGRKRRRAIAADQAMRDVAEQLELRNAIAEIEREIEVGGHPVAMRLEINGKVDLFCQPPPTLDKRNAVLQTARAHVGLDIEMVDVERRGKFERPGFQIIHRSWKALRLLDDLARWLQQRRGPARPARRRY